MVENDDANEVKFVKSDVNYMIHVQSDHVHLQMQVQI